MKYLLDTSALYPLVLKLKADFFEYVELFSILDLTFYEVGNVLWKEYRKGNVKDVGAVAAFFEEVLGMMTKISLDNELLNVEKLAVKEGLTFYDASYLYAALSHKLKLVTEDKDLLAFPVSINTEQLLKELKGSEKNERRA